MAPPVAQQLVLYQLKALDYGLVSTVQDLAEVVTDPSVETDASESFLHVVRTKLESKFQEAIKGRRDDFVQVILQVLLLKMFVLFLIIKKVID